MSAPRRNRLLIAAVLICVSLPLMGCLNMFLNWADAGEHDDRSVEVRAAEFATAAYKKAGHEGDPKAEVSEMTPDHEIAAQFILQQQGRDPDLSTYKNPQLVTLTKPDGTEILAVFVNNDEAIIAGGGQ